MSHDDHADAAVLLLLADGSHVERAGIEPHPVVGAVCGEYIGEDAANALLARIPEAEQVEITRCTVGLAGPYREERRTLEDEARRMRRAR